MTYTITQFGNDTTPALGDLDNNFAAIGVLAPIPCAVAGTNAIVLTQNQADQAASWTLTGYQNYVQVCGVVAVTNTGATTARVGALPFLNVYKDTPTGVVALSGGEMRAGNAFTLIYDSTLNTGAGGWHLVSGSSQVGATISPALVLSSGGLQVGATTTPTLTGLLSASGTLAYTAIVPSTAQDQSFTVAGLLRTDGMAVNLPLPVSTGLQFQSYFAAGDATVATVTVRAHNYTTASTITPGTITVNLKGLRTT